MGKLCLKLLDDIPRNSSLNGPWLSLFGDIKSDFEIKLDFFHPIANLGVVLAKILSLFNLLFVGLHLC